MSIDSTAELLFNIGANSDDAEANISRFRTLLGTDLDEMTAQFAAWSEELVGDISTVQGAMTGGAAVIGAAIVAIGAWANEAAGKYAEYVSEVERGSRVTGLSVESMSVLKFAATETGTSYDALVTGLTRFTHTVEKANEGGDAQQQMFARLGISQEQVKAGQTNLWPLLMAVSDAFHKMSSNVQLTGAGIDQFGKGFGQVITEMRLGSAGFEKLAEAAKKAGLVFSTTDTDAVNTYKAALHTLKAEQEGLEVAVGRAVLPWTTMWEEGKAAAWEAVEATLSWKTALLAMANPLGAFAGFFEVWHQKLAEIKEEAEAFAKSLNKLGDDPPPLEKPIAAAKEAKAEFAGLSGLLETISQRMNSGAGEIGKAAEEVTHLDFEIAKATKKYQELASAGKLTSESAKEEAAALAQLPRRLAQLWEELQQQATSKIAEEVTAFGAGLQREIIAQGQQTLASQAAAFDLLIADKRAQLNKMKDLSVDQYAEQSALIDQLQKVGDEKLGRDKAEAIAKFGDDLDREMAEQSGKSYTQEVAAWNRHVDGLLITNAKELDILGQHAAAIEALRKAGLDKIDSEQQAGYAREMGRLQAHLAGMLNAGATRVTKLAAQYSKDLLDFSQAEEKKVLLAAGDEKQIAATEATFASLRTALLTKYGTDLQALANSQGWQGVFGSHFAAGLKGNEDLMKQWASSSNQSLMMVKVSLETVKDMSQQAFDAMAKGMGAGIANALVYSKSVGAAMEAMLKSTLESLSAQAITHAIFSLALGFQDLAQYNPTGAAAAFQAAALFGAVGAAAGVAGMAVPGGGGASSASAGSGAGSGAGASGGGSGAASGTTAAPSSNGPHVVVNVQGHIFGINGVEALAGAINDAVLNRDVTLTATNTKTGQVVTQ